MKVDRKQFIEDLDIVSNALGTSAFILGFQCFHFRKDIVYATDGAFSLFRTLKYDTGLDCSVFGTPFLNTLHNIHADTLDLVQEENKLILSTKKIEGEFTIVGNPDSMKLPEYQEPDGFLLDPVMITALGKSVFAASRDESQGVNCGVCVKEDYVYATDRFRIFRYKIEDGIIAKAMRDLILPVKLIAVMKKLCKGKELLKIVKDEKTDDKKIVIFFDTMVLEGSILSGNYPKVQTWFQDLTDLMEINYDKSHLLDVLERHIAFQKNVIDIDKKIVVTISEDESFIQTSDPDIGNLNEEVEIKAGSNSITFSINPIFLKQVVADGDHLTYSPSQELIKICSDSFEYLAKVME
jgi:DNA polymerase III sliding clamp (beta) subunit (PCNA family)